MRESRTGRPGGAGARGPQQAGVQAAVLSDGEYVALVTRRGAGFSRLCGLALTAWAGDRVEDADGLFLCLRDRETGAVWSVGGGALPAEPDVWSTSWEPGCLTIAGESHEVACRLEIAVPPGAGGELRRLTVINRAARPRRLDVTTFAEVVLLDPVAHASHPAFARLFLQTERDGDRPVLLVRRRPRANGENHPWLVHALCAQDPAAGPVSCETDRARFLGRRAGAAKPAALEPGAELSGTTGSVLDPCVALRRPVDLAPGGQARLTFALGAAADREAARALPARYATDASVDAAFATARAHATAGLASLGADARQALRWQQLAAGILYGDPALRAAPAVLARAAGDPSRLARFGLSPGRPLVLLHPGRSAHAAVRAEVEQAHRYWVALGLPIDLAVVEPDGAPDSPRAGAALSIRADDLGPGDSDLLATSARLVVADELPEAPAHPPRGRRPPPAPIAPAAAADPAALVDEAPPLRFWNGHGGFTADGRGYVIPLARDGDGALRLPPLPWVNVIANESCGLIVSETGAACTWRGNSREHRLTPWANDPARDPHGEAFWLRDEASGAVWSPLPGPAPGPGAYTVTHGLGYSRFRHAANGLHIETTLFVDRDAPVRIAALRLTNGADRPRRLALYTYARLALGDTPQSSGRFVVTWRGAEPALLLARNSVAADFAGGAAFAAIVTAAAGGDEISATGDRAAFVGLGGSLAAPAAVVMGGPLDDRVGPGLDACFAQRLPLVVGPRQTVEVACLLGEESDEAAAVALVARLRAPGAVPRAFAAARDRWRDLTGGVRVKTPAPELDVLLNGWLPYQTLGCRIFARAAFYQSGGAFGYRDQLQDASSLMHLDPELTRRQIILHAAHQFVEGDVLHWWHPPAGRGLRTRFADDLLWLPYLTAAYVAATGDRGLLDEAVPYLTARQLAPGEDEAYLLPLPAGELGSVYEHCCRAIDRGLTAGRHDLPLFGAGDWNDGMNRVGREGRGESVWLGFFLYGVLDAFAPLCEARGDAARAARYRQRREAYRLALEQHAWDGDWYRRGWYDDGAVLGSRASDECRIDALAQAWAVISGAAAPARAARALDAVEEHLISDRDGLIRLLAPPFDATPHDPGYIKGYVPGVRENGGQYTHAATWVVRALAEIGRRQRAAALLALLNPINHARTREQVARYKVEPYVICADVYGAEPHVGRGGWTWYTGSSGWYWRVALENVLGLRLEAGARLVVKPCIPDEWPAFTVDYRLPDGRTTYALRVANPRACSARVTAGTLDGVPLAIDETGAIVPLARDGARHVVEITLGP